MIRHWRGVVPSNSLACLHGLTEDVRERGLLGGVEIRTHVIDESVTRIPLAEIARRNRSAGCRALACLVGVWRRFYSLENMKAILGRVDPARYWDVFRNFVWYNYAVAAEGAHQCIRRRRGTMLGH